MLEVALTIKWVKIWLSFAHTIAVLVQRSFNNGQLPIHSNLYPVLPVYVMGFHKYAAPWLGKETGGCKTLITFKSSRVTTAIFLRNLLIVPQICLCLLHGMSGLEITIPEYLASNKVEGQPVTLLYCSVLHFQHS